MKKLLSLLSISTLTTSVPAPLLANTTPERIKNDVDKKTAQLSRSKRENNKVYDFEIKDLEKVRFHFGDRATWAATKLIEVNINKKDNSDLNEKLPELKKLNNLTFKFIKSEFSNNQNKQDEIRKLITTYGTKVGIKEWVINKKITIRAKGTILNDYKQDDNTTDYSLICTNAFKIDLDSIDWVKQQSQFTLVDRTKTTIWTRNDLITVDDELNIAIANPNIDKVIFDNVQQSQTNKQWNINVKPENTPRDHRLQVSFTLDGKQHTSEITVSMQAKIDAPAPIIKENLSDVIKFGDENNLGNILDNNDNTIISAITQTNSRIIDFSQLEITNKESNQATLTAKPDSKSYAGSVEVTYNVVPTTIVDLKIDLDPTASEAIVVKDYVGQIDPSAITNPVQTFYFVNSESTITIKKPTISSVITGVVYACDEQWNKTVQATAIDATNGIKLDGSQLATSNGKYVVELSDNLGHTNNLYLQIAPKQAITNYFDTSNGKQFEQRALVNGHDNIRGVSARQLNKLFATSRSWTPQENGSENANSFNPQITNSNSPNNNENGLTGWAIIGIVIGALSGLLLLGWLVKKFLVTPFILEPIRKKKVEAFQRQTAKDIAQMKADEAEEEAKRKGEK